MANDEPITEDWLREVGFQWHQLDRQPNKQWLLWIGRAMDDRMTCAEDIGIEVATSGRQDAAWWFCWLRSDAAHRYHRFIHLRHLQTRGELIAIIEALTGKPWNPALHIFGMVHSEKYAQWIAESRARLDNVIREQGSPWTSTEKDPDRGRPLIEHLEAAVKSGGVT